MRKEGDKFPLRMLALITQIGINMMVPIFMCAGIGYLVSNKTGMEILFVFFMVLGIMAGFRSCYSLIRRFVSLDSSQPTFAAGQGKFPEDPGTDTEPEDTDLPDERER